MMTTELDYQKLDRLMDRVKARVFTVNHGAFLAPLMAKLNFTWAEDIPTACTNGISIQWNPHWFLEIPERTRLTVLKHELWHVAFMHMIRRGHRNPRIWNYACDIAINNMLHVEGDSFDGTSPWIDDDFNKKLIFPTGNYREAPAEEIYESLIAIMPNLGSMWGVEGDQEGDLVEPEDNDPDTERQIVSTVVSAVATASLGGHMAGSLPGEIETTLKRFLQPKLPWEQLLFNFFNDLAEEDYTMRRPNRRHHHKDIYLPSLEADNGLEHLIYFLDVSGSVSDNEVIRFNSEVKYIKEHFNPLKLTLVLFDTMIQKEYVFNQEDSFDEVVIVGRGGTSLVPVREYILEHEPTAAIIFSDLHCTVMEKLPIPIPIIWVCINNTSAKVNEGKLIHIKE